MATFPSMSFGEVAKFYKSSSPTLIEGNPWAGAAVDIARLIESIGSQLTADQAVSLLAIGAMAYHESARRLGEGAPGAFEADDRSA